MNRTTPSNQIADEYLIAFATEVSNNLVFNPTAQSLVSEFFWLCIKLKSRGPGLEVNYGDDLDKIFAAFQKALKSDHELLTYFSIHPPIHDSISLRANRWKPFDDECNYRPENSHFQEASPMEKASPSTSAEPFYNITDEQLLLEQGEPARILGKYKNPTMVREEDVIKKQRQ